jgi:opacity protein-like surface antigen
MKNIKLSVAAVLSAGVLAATLAPEAALAHNTGKKHTHKATKTTTTRSSSAASSSSSSVERRLRELEDEVATLRAEASRAKSIAPAKVQEIESRQAQLEQQVAEAKEHEDVHHDLLFFRGGYAQMSHARSNELLLNSTTYNSLGLTSNPNVERDGDGWYVGAGFDHTLTDDLWGLSDLASVDGEVMFQYMNFGSGYNSLVDYASNAAIGATGTSTVTIKNQITQLTISASPKIKFNLMEGALRPWIIPFGLSINVISPPSSGVTVLNPGLMLGTGVEYNIWKSLWAGIDFRYNFTGDDLNYKAQVGGLTVYNKTNTDGLTTGAYLGFGF